MVGASGTKVGQGQPATAPGPARGLPVLVGLRSTLVGAVTGYSPLPDSRCSVPAMIDALDYWSRNHRPGRTGTHTSCSRFGAAPAAPWWSSSSAPATAATRQIRARTAAWTRASLELLCKQLRAGNVTPRCHSGRCERRCTARTWRCVLKGDHSSDDLVAQDARAMATMMGGPVRIRSSARSSAHYPGPRVLVSSGQQVGDVDGLSRVGGPYV
jgi:hypothetical protein